MDAPRVATDPGATESRRHHVPHTPGARSSRAPSPAVALAAPAVAQADVIGDWNVIAQTQAIPLRPTAHGQTRGIAMVQGAVYDAVNAIDRGHQPYLLDVEDSTSSRGRRTTRLSPPRPTTCSSSSWRRRQVAALDTAYQATLDGDPRRAVEQEGVAAGEAAAAAMLDAREDDGYLGPFDFSLVIGPDPGDWRPVTADGARPRRLGRQPQAVRHREPVAVPLGGPQRPDERRLREGLQRGEGRSAR